MTDEEWRVYEAHRKAQMRSLERGATYLKTLMWLVRPPGFEPGALRLRVECSTN